MVPRDDLPKTKAEAKQAGLVAYFTGVMCRNGHLEPRYTNTGICYGCKRDRRARDYVNHKPRVLATSNKSRRNNLAARAAGSRKWAAANRENSNAIKEKSRQKHFEKNRDSVRARAQLKRQCPIYRLSHAVACGIWRAIRKNKAGRHWEIVVGFDLVALAAHLESRFTPTMTWDNYGTYWEIDHIKPVSLCESFAEMWALSNLQPLPCSVNRSKQAQRPWAPPPAN